MRTEYCFAIRAMQDLTKTYLFNHLCCTRNGCDTLVSGIGMCQGREEGPETSQEDPTRWGSETGHGDGVPSTAGKSSMGIWRGWSFGISRMSMDIKKKNCSMAIETSTKNRIQGNIRQIIRWLNISWNISILDRSIYQSICLSMDLSTSLPTYLSS